MTTIFIENCLADGKTVTIIENFGAHTLRQSLKPGENARLTVSRHRSIVLEETDAGVAREGDGGRARGNAISETWPSFLQRCRG